MMTKFFLFQSHIDLAHSYWEQLVEPGDTVIDATCGNGHDTLILSTLALKEGLGTVYAFDIQEMAIKNSHELLSKNLKTEDFAQVKFIQESHADFPSIIQPNSVKLIVYNLGYLPGGDKHKTTLSEVTAQSIQKAMELVMPGGLISITCYPGHPEGALEEAYLLKLEAALDPKSWSCCHHRWINRKHAPSLLLMQKGI